MSEIVYKFLGPEHALKVLEEHQLKVSRLSELNFRYLKAHYDGLDVELYSAKEHAEKYRVMIERFPKKP
jgi:hypothetical protein